MSSNQNPLSTNSENDSSANNHNSSSDTTDLIVQNRRRSGFRRRGDTTTIEGPTGAPPLGASTMVGAAGGGAVPGPGPGHRGAALLFQRDQEVLLRQGHADDGRRVGVH